jgi:hypothetical protein
LEDDLRAAKLRFEQATAKSMSPSFPGDGDDDATDGAGATEAQSLEHMDEDALLELIEKERETVDIIR